MTGLATEYTENEKIVKLTKMIKEVNHEFNNSLTTILGFTQIVMDSEKLDSGLKGYMDIIYESALHSKSIVERIDDLEDTRNKYQKLNVSINDLVESSINMASIRCRDVSQSKNIEIKFVKNLESRSNIYVNTVEIRAVILNLLLNAIDSLDEDGEIKVDSRECDGQLILEISDNGEGIDENMLGKLFDPYFTTKDDNGTGLGLSISKRIIEEHNGRIEVESKKGVGTTFKIYLQIT